MGILIKGTSIKILKFKTIIASCFTRKKRDMQITISYGNTRHRLPAGNISQIVGESPGIVVVSGRNPR